MYSADEMVSAKSVWQTAKLIRNPIKINKKSKFSNRELAFFGI
jgi:hypothetical protein